MRRMFHTRKVLESGFLWNFEYLRELKARRVTDEFFISKIRF